MRIRTIKPEFWSHPVLSKLDDSSRLCAIGLLNIADDEGYFLAEPSLIRSALWPFDESSTNARRVLDALTLSGYIEVREHPTHGKVGWVINFKKHQRIDRPSPSKIRTYYDSTNDQRVIDEPSLLEGNREQGKEQGKETSRTHKARSYLESLGAKTMKGSEDLITEWEAVLKGLRNKRIEEIFANAKPGIIWPSQFLQWRNAQGSY